MSHPTAILPYDGEAILYPEWYAAGESQRYFEELLRTSEWQNDEVVMFGKRLTMSRKTAWYGLQPFRYTYSHVERTALPFTPVLEELRRKCEETTGHTFNSALLNLYHHGMEGMGKHSDDEDSIVPKSGIASLSFGAERPFVFLHKKTREKIKVSLPDGSLLLMKDRCQECWWHELPKTRKVSGPRINITFRLMKI
jgi:alkylated DNA repair dioxygenase AlkB